MDCRDTKLLMDAYWDRHLPTELTAQVEDHLADCPSCRGEYGGVTELLARPDPVAVPAGLRERILAAVSTVEIQSHPQAPAGRSYRWWMDLLHAPWAGATAACLVFAFLGWIGFQIPVRGPDAVSSGTNARTAPDPMLLAGWTQSLAVPGPGRALPALVQAVAIERALRPELPEMSVRNRVLEQAVEPPSEAPPAIHEIGRIVAGLSTLGA
ncbi:MAG: zf-HC2 domain-containing protein [Phycisphaerae bacterium]|jgi:anti-sigma factor RsiW